MLLQLLETRELQLLVPVPVLWKGCLKCGVPGILPVAASPYPANPEPPVEDPVKDPVVTRPVPCSPAYATGSFDCEYDHEYASHRSKSNFFPHRLRHTINGTGIDVPFEHTNSKSAKLCFLSKAFFDRATASAGKTGGILLTRTRGAIFCAYSTNLRISGLVSWLTVFSATSS